MNEENKNVLNNTDNTNENTVEMPVTKEVKESVNPLEKTIESKIVKPTPVASAPAPEPSKPEVGSVVVGNPMSNVIKPIPVGDIQGSGPVATVGGGNTPSEPKKKSNIISIIILVVALLCLVGIVLFRYVFKGNINFGSLNGTVQGNVLVYKGVKKGNKINFKVTDSLKLVLSIDELEVQDGVGTKVTCSIKEADGTDSVSLNNIWLEDDNETIKVEFNKVGDYAVISNNFQNTKFSIISNDGTLTTLDDLSSYINEEKGLTVGFSVISDDEIKVEASRKSDMGVIYYGDLKTEIDYSAIADNEEELVRVSRYSMGDGFAMCIDDITKIPETTTITAIFTFKLKDGKLDLNNPEISDKVDFKTYYEEYKEVECY